MKFEELVKDAILTIQDFQNQNPSGIVIIR